MVEALTVPFVPLNSNKLHSEKHWASCLKADTMTRELE